MEELQAYRISGKISGAAIAGVTVNLAGRIATGPVARTTTTDDAGRYAFDVLANGTYTVTPSLPPGTCAFTPASMAVEVRGADVTGIDFACG